MVAVDALSPDDLQHLVCLRGLRSDPFDDATRAFLGPSKHVATLWPHCLGSAVNRRSSGRARGAVQKLLRALEIRGTCPACGEAPLAHRVHEVQIMEYADAGAWSPVHQDSPLDDDPVARRLPLEKQGALICVLERRCSGGVLHVASASDGRIAHRREDGEPLDLARDATAVPLGPGDVCMFANVEHMVTRLESGSRLVLSARLSCPARTLRRQVRRVGNVDTG